MQTKLRKLLVQRYFRLTRAMTLGGRGIVVDKQGRVLLIRHGYIKGWHLPGGGVEKGETIETSTMREIVEETGVIVQGKPELHGIFSQHKAFPNDHVAIYVVRDWEQPTIPKPNMEIKEQGFFALDDLPEGITQGTQDRLDEVFNGKEISLEW